MRTTLSGPHFSALRRWRRVVAPRIGQLEGLIAVGLQSRDRRLTDFVDLNDVTMTVVHQDASRRDRPALRFAGFALQLVPFGVMCGGLENVRFDHDLALRPRYRATGRRIDVRRLRLLHCGIDLCEAIHGCLGEEALVDVELPKLWAALPQAYSPEPDGPELVGRMCEEGVTRTELLRRNVRIHEGRALIPMAWVSHDWQRFDAVFVEPSSVPPFQVVRCDDVPAALMGFRGACQFDFLTSPYRGATANGRRSESSLVARCRRIVESHERAGDR